MTTLYASLNSLPNVAPSVQARTNYWQQQKLKSSSVDMLKQYLQHLH